MDINQWKRAVQIHINALELLLENIFEQGYSVNMQETGTGSNEEAAAQMEQAEFVVRFVEKNFQAEVFIGFSEQWMALLAEHLVSATEQQEKLREELMIELSTHVKDIIIGSLSEVEVEVEIASIDTIDTGSLSGAFNLQHYFRADIEAKGDDGQALHWWVAMSHPEKEQVKIYKDQFEDDNPFLDERYQNIAERFARHVNMTRDKSGSTGYDSGMSMEGQQVEFEDFGKSKNVKSTREVRNIDILKDVEMDLSVELGRREMPLGNILQLVKGSVIELEKLAGEPVEILVNGHKIAQGDVVVIDEHFGVRISNLLASQERIKELQ